MGNTENRIEITAKERKFCELLMGSNFEYAGRIEVCYTKVYGEAKDVAIESRRVLSQPHVAEYINELVELRESEIERSAIKRQVAETLRTVMAETAKSEYVDKFGVPLSPASLRAVSVNAAKALMDIYPITNAHTQAAKTESGGNIIFNVVVPQTVTKDGDKEEDSV